jgi:fatty acid desaturase
MAGGVQVSPLPNLEALGNDLLVTTPSQRRLALLRPFIGIAAFVIAFAAGLWWTAPFIVFLIFVAVVTVTHDVVHRSLGLTPRQTEWVLFAMGAALLESGHAYCLTHRQHHSRFPHDDDPEGDPARMRFWGAVCHGVVFLPRLWLWAYCQSAGNYVQRRWLIAEAAWAVGFVLVSAVVAPWSLAPVTYAALAIVGSWVYPLLTVHLPHRNYGDTPLTQTHTLRGWIIPKLFLELTYHLEHHLYPQVPSHNLPRLSQRLDPFLRSAGVVPRRVL